jgi:hypothetical protein
MAPRTGNAGVSMTPVSRDGETGVFRFGRPIAQVNIARIFRRLCLGAAKASTMPGRV